MKRRLFLLGLPLVPLAALQASWEAEAWRVEAVGIGRLAIILRARHTLTGASRENRFEVWAAGDAVLTVEERVRAEELGREALGKWLRGLRP